jgi:RNA polymerase sigma-70 factor (ECF subfamily)
MDEELCAMVAQHSDQAFKELVRHHQARVYRIAYAVLGNEAEARSISQDAFIRLFKSAHKFDGASRHSTWFYRVVVSLCIRRREKWWRRLLPSGGSRHDLDRPGIEPASVGEGAGQAVVKHQLAGRVDDALKRLSANQRIALLLHVQDGFSSREIAEVLDCSENAALVHIHRGLAALKGCLGINSDAGRPS